MTVAWPIVDRYFVRRVVETLPQAVYSLALVLAGRVLLGPTLGSIFFAYLVGCWGSVMGLGRRTVTLRSAVAGCFAAMMGVADLGSLHAATLVLILLLISAAFLGSSQRLLMRCGLPEVVARAMVIIGGFIYVGWPMYLAGAWTDGRVSSILDRLTSYHPLLVMNGLYPELGDWTHRPIAYRYLFNLGQDVPFALPASAWPLIWLLMTGVVGIAMIATFITVLHGGRRA
ncbi:MAG: hypothetical protein ACTHLN_15875 [Tepidisphaeraceae bacterium]